MRKSIPNFKKWSVADSVSFFANKSDSKQTRSNFRLRFGISGIQSNISEKKDRNDSNKFGTSYQLRSSGDTQLSYGR
jgi:hypothetical protein